MCDVPGWVCGGEDGGVEFWIVRLVLGACAFFADEVEERVDQEGDGCVEGFCWRVAACEDLEDVGDRRGEVLREVGVEVSDVEEQLERFRKSHQVHGRCVLLCALPRLGVAVCVPLDRGVGVVCQVVLVHQVCVVEVCVVGCEEEDTREQELIVNTFAL